MTRRLLFVAFFFPPIGGVSVPRTLGHVRILPEHGWDATVLTPGRSAYRLHDPGLLAAVPEGTQVLRTHIVEPAAIKRRLLQLLRFRWTVDSGRRRDAGTRSSPTSSRPRRPAGSLERWRRFIFFPDDEIGWFPFAVFAGIRAHRRAAFSAILSSSSPLTAHLIAGVIARRVGVPWVAEFRDPWVGNALAHPSPWIQRELARRIERWIVGNADRCVFVTPSLTELYRARYPMHGDRFATITNAYDLDTDPSHHRLTPSPAGERIRIVYAGTLDRPAELATFIAGVRRYQSQPRTAPPVRVEFYGYATDECDAILACAARELDPESISYGGFIPRSEVRKRLAAADGALVLLGNGPGMELFVGGKLYEHLGADRRILAMLPPGDAQDLLTSIGWGTIAAPSPESVADAIRRFGSESGHRAVADPERRFERSRVVARLAAVLDSTVVEGDSR